MNNAFRKPLNSALVLGVLFLAAGCATRTPRQAIYVNPQFNPMEVELIAVLPVADVRKDHTLELKLTKWIQSAGNNLLRGKKYKVQLDNSTNAVATITEDDLKRLDPAWIKSLPPAQSRWVMLFVVNDVTRELTYGSTSNAEIEGFLFDREQGVVLWRDKAIGQMGVGGLMGMAFIGVMAHDAVMVAMQTLMETFPKREELKP